MPSSLPFPQPYLLLLCIFVMMSSVFCLSALLSSQKRAFTEAALAEKTSLEGIRLVVVATCEALALWQLLAENQLHVLATGRMIFLVTVSLMII